MKMGSWVAFFLVIAILAALVSPGGIAGAVAGIVQFSVFAFLVLCGAAFISGLRVMNQQADR